MQEFSEFECQKSKSSWPRQCNERYPGCVSKGPLRKYEGRGPVKIGGAPKYCDDAREEARKKIEVPGGA